MMRKENENKYACVKRRVGVLRRVVLTMKHVKHVLKATRKGVSWKCLRTKCIAVHVTCSANTAGKKGSANMRPADQREGCMFHNC